MKHSISLKNLIRKPVRSFGLIILSALLCFSILGGTLIISGLNTGLKSLETRLGADIMVVPYEAATKKDLENIVLQGNTGYFYMDSSVVDKIRNMEGVDQVSEQFFLASAFANCCSLRVQIIGYDPETDFTISPWIRNSYAKDLGYMEILVGNDLNAFAGDKLKFYGSVVKVASRLEKTGTYLDQAVYANKETIKTLIKSAKESKLMDFGNVDPDKIVSCVLVNVKEGYVTEEVLNDIKTHVRKAEAIQTKSMISSVSDGLISTSRIIKVLMGIIWLLSVAVLGFAFAMITNERKKEFAVLRISGASQSGLASIMMKEALTVSLAGSILGAAFAVLSVEMFSSFIENDLDLPFLLPGAADIALFTAAAVIASVLAGSLSAFFSARRICKVDPAVILRGDN